MTNRVDTQQVANTPQAITTLRATETGDAVAVTKAKNEAWLKKNKVAIDAHNERIKRVGTHIAPNWLED